MPSPASTATWSALLADMEFSLWQAKKDSTNTSSLRAKRSNPCCGRRKNGLLRRFAPRNDGKKRILRREHRAPDQPALLQIDQRLIGFGQRHRRHRNGRDLLGAHEIEQLLRLPEIADIAAL